MRIALTTPIDPHAVGTGLAHRARLWQLALAELGALTTVVVPVAGPAPRTGAVVVRPERVSHRRFPPLAQLAPEYLGARLSCEIEPFDVVVALRSYLGPFAVGLANTNRCPVVVDLDDDDAALCRQRGEEGLARSYDALVGWLAPRVAAFTTAAPGGVGGRVPTHHVPNALPDVTPPEQSGESVVLYVGNFDYAPNREGASWFEAAIVPPLLERHPAATIVIAGPKSGDFEHGVGFVEDLTELYRRATVVAAPILSGSGSRIKVIEAWQHHRPVVATTVALAGLEHAANRDAVVADDASAFVDALHALLIDPGQAHELGAAGRRTYETHHELGMAAARIRALVGEVALGRPPALLVAPVADLEITEVDDGAVVFDPVSEQVHHLNPTAAAIFVAADGQTRSDEIAELLATAFDLDEPPLAEVYATLLDLVSRGLLTT